MQRAPRPSLRLAEPAILTNPTRTIRALFLRVQRGELRSAPTGLIFRRRSIFHGRYAPVPPDLSCSIRVTRRKVGRHGTRPSLKLFEIEDLLSNVDNTAVFEKEIGTDQTTELVLEVVRSLR